MLYLPTDKTLGTSESHLPFIHLTLLGNAQGLQDLLECHFKHLSS